VNPFDQIKTLQARIDAATETIEDLKTIIIDLTCGNHDEIKRLQDHYKISLAHAKMLILLAKAKGRTLSKEWLVVNSRGTPFEKSNVPEPYHKIVDIYMWHLRKAGIPVKTNYGLGRYIEPQDCEPILKIAKGQTDEPI
jgi:DNA-binding response OmpR family regulator